MQPLKRSEVIEAIIGRSQRLPVCKLIKEQFNREYKEAKITLTFSDAVGKEQSYTFTHNAKTETKTNYQMYEFLKSHPEIQIKRVIAEVEQ